MIIGQNQGFNSQGHTCSPCVHHGLQAPWLLSIVAYEDRELDWIPPDAAVVQSSIAVPMIELKCSLAAKILLNFCPNRHLYSILYCLFFIRLDYSGLNMWDKAAVRYRLHVQCSVLIFINRVYQVVLTRYQFKTIHQDQVYNQSYQKDCYLYTKGIVTRAISDANEAKWMVSSTE